MPSTLSTLLTSTRANLDEATARFWTDAQLTTWINDACRDIARRTETIQSAVTTTISAIEFRASTQNRGTSATATVANPTTTLNDFLIVSIAHPSATTVTTPTGFTLIATSTGSSYAISTYSRVVDGTENRTLAFSLSGSSAFSIGACAFLGVGSVETDAINVTTTTSPSATPSNSGVAPVSDYNQILFIAANFKASAFTGSPSYTPPANYPEHVDVSLSGTPSIALTMTSRGPIPRGNTGALSTTFTESSVCHSQTITLAPSPSTVISGSNKYYLPTDVLRVHRVEFQPLNEQTLYPIQAASLEELDQIWGIDQQTQMSYPSFYCLWGFPPNLQIQFYPAPSTEGSFRVFYYRLPKTLTNSSDIAEIPEGWEDLVVLYCESEAKRKDRQQTWADSRALYEEKIKDLVDTTRRWHDQAGTFVNTGGGNVPNYLWDGGDY